MRNKIKKYVWVILLLFLAWWLFYSLPSQLFDAPYSTILTDRNGQVLSARIADDGQWRFPELEEIPIRYEEALLSFEDRHYYHHPGVNPLAIARAFRQNLKEKRLVSGGSTITMQVIRMSRKRKGRSVAQKLIESVLALRLELRTNKKEILKMHAAHAPYGGNVVGLEAAAWRYYSRSPATLSWAEAATLAVLPNAPNLIHPGKNRNLLLAKRNRLLKRMLEYKKISKSDYSLALLEELPRKPLPLPQETRHLLDHSISQGQKGKRIKTSIDINAQSNANQIIKTHYEKLSQNEIYNICALIIDVKSNQVISYVGNSPSDIIHSPDVDIIQSHRSTGSILKPFLYASMMQSGQLLPKTLIPDIPTEIGGYIPINYNKKYDGAVAADEALTRSLNIPAVRMLQKYGIQNFHSKLSKLNINSINYPAHHYGLTLILGGAEASLWDLANAYKNMARTINQNEVHPHTYYDEDWTTASYNLMVDKRKINKIIPPLNAGAIYLTMEALTQVKRPDSENGWEYFNSTRKIAWKTGTSHGFRDAWAIGVTPEYVAAVWVGNADGAGRPGLVGIEAAAPILFDLFDVLPATTWFKAPHDELRLVETCRTSGHLANPNCPEMDSTYIHKNGLYSASCPYHNIIHLDQTKSFQVNSDCYPVSKISTEINFELPSNQAYYFSQKNANYSSPPPCLPNCAILASDNISIIYPHKNSHITIPNYLDGTEGKSIFKVTHSIPNTRIFWYVDDQYLGVTEYPHQMELSPDIGNHVLTLTDGNGEKITRKFEVVL